MRLLALMLFAFALAAQDPVDFSGWLNRGVQEFRSAHYPEAAAAFERAVAIDPSNVTAQLYLGTAYMQQYIPGADSPENRRVAEAAYPHFLRVLELDQHNKVALASIASLFLNQKRWDEAQRWYEKLVAVEPNNADAYYSMGFIAWSKWYPAYGKARADAGMRQEEPGPIVDAVVRADLKARYGPVIESGLRALEKALAINPQYDDAMAYMNLLIRERADLRDTVEECQRDVRIADQWVQKALATKKAKYGGGGGGGQSAPPPPPPPVRNEAARPRRITIGGDVSQPMHIARLVYPEQAKQAHIQGDVHLRLQIDTKGHVFDIKVISGHPLLVPAALDAVKQWEFKPTLLHGQAVEVQTEVTIPFKL